MATAIAVARLLTHRAAAEGGSGDGAIAEAAMAYLQAAETAAAVTLESMRIHGGYGYTAEFPWSATIETRPCCSPPPRER